MKVADTIDDLGIRQSCGQGNGRAKDPDQNQGQFGFGWCERDFVPYGMNNLEISEKDNIFIVTVSFGLIQYHAIRLQVERKVSNAEEKVYSLEL